MEPMKVPRFSSPLTDDKRINVNHRYAATDGADGCRCAMPCRPVRIELTEEDFELKEIEPQANQTMLNQDTGESQSVLELLTGETGDENGDETGDDTGATGDTSDETGDTGGEAATMAVARFSAPDGSVEQRLIAVFVDGKYNNPTNAILNLLR